MKFRFLWTLYRAIPGHAGESDYGRFIEAKQRINGKGKR
jgi:hypothetical protein